MRLFYEHRKVVVERLEHHQKCSDVGLHKEATLRAAFVGPTEPSAPVEAAMAGLGTSLANVTRLVGRCEAAMEELQKKEHELVQRKARLQKRNGDKKLKDKIKIKTSTLVTSTRRSVLQFFPRTRLAALFSGCYDSEFIMHDCLPFLDENL